ncbi:AAA family ATPase, partial [Cellulosimicrobium sp. CUA-896]|uniref:AAA family ATPase n=1 Tax=Cellulosimicrobium sp. CUA-896 TaxID=1517881 RepID=UPI000A9E2530
MHLHSLTFQAIGPFPGRHRIDLAALGASGIFLLDGPTGAGKSTIIDTVVFALYGKVASEQASDDRLRSAYAEPSVESFVDLVLEVPAGVFRVRRTPEYRRPKKRGEGTTTQQASVRLWRLPSVPSPAEEDPVGELLSTRLDEAGAEIQRLVGLDRRQLVQTVVLPQGEFATFLRADPERRRDLLQKVFGTELYDRASVRLAELARTARGRVDLARQAVTGAVEHFCGASGLATEDARGLRDACHDDTRLRRATDDEVDALLGDLEMDALLGDLEADAPAPGVHALALAHARRREALAQALEADDAAARAALTTARERLDAERSTAAALDRRAALGAEKERLAAREPHVAEQVARLDAAGRAAVVAPAARAALTADRALAAALERQELARTGVPADLAEADPGALEAVRSDVLTASVRVARLLPVGAGLPARERELADGRKEVERAAEERRRVLADVAERPAAREALRARVAERGEAAARLDALQERAGHARSVAAAAREVRVLEAEHDRAADARTRAADTAVRAVGTERRVRTARIAGIAGELAASLVDDAPCPVCGSPEHPDPAGRTDDHATPEDVEAAEAARVAAEEALRDASADVARLAERLQALRQTAQGLDADAAQAQVAALEEAVAQARTASTERETAERELDEHDATTRALHARAAELAETVAASTSRLDELAAALAADVAEIAREADAARSLVSLGGDLPTCSGTRAAPATPSPCSPPRSTSAPGRSPRSARPTRPWRTRGATPGVAAPRSRSSSSTAGSPTRRRLSTPSSATRSGPASRRTSPGTARPSPPCAPAWPTPPSRASRPTRW